MTVVTTTETTATCDREGCGLTVDLGNPDAITVSVATSTGVTKHLAFCSKAHCNTWWQTATGENLIS